MQRFYRSSRGVRWARLDYLARLVCSVRLVHLSGWLVGAFLLWCAETGMAYSAPKTVLVVGDSLSAEYGLARGTGWVALLDARFKQQHINATVVNASISGDTTSGGNARLPDLLKKQRPDVVLIELGVNDGLRGLPIADAEKNLRAMVTASRGAGAKVLLVGMQIPPNYGSTYTKQFSAMYAHIANDTHVPLVPFLLANVAERSDLFQADQIHLQASAHPQLLENVWPYVLPLVSGK